MTRVRKDYRAILESHLNEIEDVVTFACRRSGFRPEEVEDFRSWVHVKLLEKDFRILRSFSEKSSLVTFLHAVVINLARDYRTKSIGRWRPSAAAEREGWVAVEVERLIDRDGFSLDEAVEMLRKNEGCRMTTNELWELAGRLPSRQRMTVEGGDQVEGAAGGEAADARAEGSDQARTMALAREALDESLRELDPEVRLLIRMKYESGLTVAAIAEAMNVPSRRLYSLHQKALSRLRQSFERRGLDPHDVVRAVSKADEEPPEEAGMEPSNLREDDNPSIEGGDRND